MRLPEALRKCERTYVFLSELNSPSLRGSLVLDEGVEVKNLSTNWMLEVWFVLISST